MISVSVLSAHVSGQKKREKKEEDTTQVSRGLYNFGNHNCLNFISTKRLKAVPVCNVSKEIILYRLFSAIVAYIDLSGHCF